MPSHLLISEDDSLVACLVCGGIYRERDLHVEDCSHDTAQRHGDPREHGDDVDDARYSPDCACLLCRA